MPRAQHSPDLFACDICATTFTRRADLQRHERVHAEDVEELKLACPYDGCFYRTLQKSNLKTHVTARHLKEKPHKCQYFECDHSFADGAALIRHERSKHGIMRNKAPRGTKPQNGNAGRCQIILDPKSKGSAKEGEKTKEVDARRSSVEKKDKSKANGKVKGKDKVKQEDMEIVFTVRKEDNAIEMAATEQIEEIHRPTILPLSDSNEKEKRAQSSSSSSSSPSSPSLSSSSPSSSSSSSSPYTYSQSYSPPLPSYHTPPLDPTPSSNTLIPLSPVQSPITLPPIKDIFPDLFSTHYASTSAPIRTISSMKQNGMIEGDRGYIHVIPPMRVHSYDTYGALGAPNRNWDRDSTHLPAVKRPPIDGSRNPNRRHTYNTNYPRSNPYALYRNLRSARWDDAYHDDTTGATATKKLARSFSNMSFNYDTHVTPSGYSQLSEEEDYEDEDEEDEDEGGNYDDIDVDGGSKPQMQLLPVVPMRASFHPASSYRHS